MMSIGGVHLERDLGLHLLAESEETVIPQVRQESVVIPGRHGEIVFDSYLESKRLFPSVLIPRQATLYDVQDILRKVVSLLVDEYGRPKDVKVVYDYEPDKYMVARMNGYLSPERISTAGKFLIPLYANDPFLYSSLKSNEITWGSDTPMMAEIQWNTGVTEVFISSPQTVTIVNSGTITSRLSFFLEGSGTNVSIKLNGKTFSLGTFSNTSWDVRGEDYTIFKNGSYNISDYSGEFLELKPGSNTISFSGTGMNLNFSESNRFKYL